MYSESTYMNKEQFYVFFLDAFCTHRKECKLGSCLWGGVKGNNEGDSFEGI